MLMLGMSLSRLVGPSPLFFSHVSRAGMQEGRRSADLKRSYGGGVSPCVMCYCTGPCFLPPAMLTA